LQCEIRWRQRAEQAAHRAARHDHLTGLPNRLSFTEHFGPGGASSTAVFLIDLDGFKSINDTGGHAVGDEVLKIVARRLQQVTASYAGAVARMGGDEFSCLLRPAPSNCELVRMGREIVGAISKPIVLAGVELSVAASVGIACSDEVLVDQDELLRRADVAMYAAKRTDVGQISLFGGTKTDTIMAARGAYGGSAPCPTGCG